MRRLGTQAPDTPIRFGPQGNLPPFPMDMQRSREALGACAARIPFFSPIRFLAGHKRKGATGFFGKLRIRLSPSMRLGGSCPRSYSAEAWFGLPFIRSISFFGFSHAIAHVVSDFPHTFIKHCFCAMCCFQAGACSHSFRTGSSISMVYRDFCAWSFLLPKHCIFRSLASLLQKRKKKKFLR